MKIFLSALFVMLAVPAFAQAQYTANISWTDNSLSETEFRIEKNTGGMWFEVGTVAADITVFTDPNLLEVAKEYCYRVVASNVTGATMSEASCANTPTGVPPIPEAPTGVTIEFVEVVPAGNAVE